MNLCSSPNHDTLLQNPDTGDLIFRNNLTLVEQPRPPEGIDLFGGLSALTHLNVTCNKLVQLPASICSMVHLKVPHCPALTCVKASVLTPTCFFPLTGANR